MGWLREMSLREGIILGTIVSLILIVTFEGAERRARRRRMSRRRRYRVGR